MRSIIITNTFMKCLWNSSRRTNHSSLGHKGIKISKITFTYIKLILSIMKYFFPDYVSLLNITLHIAYILYITSKFFNNKTKQVSKLRSLLNIVILSTAMNNSSLYHACGLHHYKCLREKYKGYTIVLHFESKRVPKGLDRTQVVLKFTRQQYMHR